MKAVVKRGNALELDTNFAEPTPGEGQVLVRTLACGICGSDLHALHHLDHMADMSRRSGSLSNLNPNADIVFGHEFAFEVLDYGKNTARRLPTGTVCTSFPAAAGPQGMELVGYSNLFPGGFSELMVLQEELLLPVPEGLPVDLAAMTEPFAVGEHAVARARLDPRTVAMVIGCGPVGLAVIAALKLRGVGPIVAADLSAERRKTAEAMGADIVIDPAEGSPHDQWASLGVAQSLAEASVWAMTGKESRPAVVFECVGVPGMIQSLLENGPPGAQIVVVGVCMETDRFEPGIAINKQMGLDFVFGYSPEEFAATLHNITEGRIAASTVLSGTVGLDGVADAFRRLSSEPALVKVLVKP